MPWRVELGAGARKDLRAIRDTRLRGRLIRAMQGLEADPQPPSAKRLVWRVRVGDWRISYAVRNEVLPVLVIAVGTRSEIYEMVRRREK